MEKSVYCCTMLQNSDKNIVDFLKIKISKKFTCQAGDRL